MGISEHCSGILEHCSGISGALLRYSGGNARERGSPNRSDLEFWTASPSRVPRRVAFAIRCAQRRPRCLRGSPPSASRGRGRAVGWGRPSVRQRRGAVTNPALPGPRRVLREHRPVARATGGKGPLKERCRRRTGRGTTEGGRASVQPTRVRAWCVRGAYILSGMWVPGTVWRGVIRCSDHRPGCPPAPLAASEAGG